MGVEEVRRGTLNFLGRRPSAWREKLANTNKEEYNHVAWEPQLATVGTLAETNGADGGRRFRAVVESFEYINRNTVSQHNA